VITPFIDTHVGFRRHMTIDTLRTTASRFVMVVFHRIVLHRQVALAAQRVGLGTKCQAVRLMTVRAGNASMIHAALNERSKLEHLSINLAIGVIKTGFQIGRRMGIEQLRARRGVRRDHAAPRMAGGARIEFRRNKGFRTFGDASLGVHLPMAVVRRLQPVRQSKPRGFPSCHR